MLDGFKKQKENKTSFRKDTYSGKGRPKKSDYVDLKRFEGEGYNLYELDEYAEDTRPHRWEGEE